MPEHVLVLDCGSTNITAAAVDGGGRIAAAASEPNAPVPQQDGGEGWLVWDLDALWKKICAATRTLLSEVEPESVAAVTVATMGADGAPVTAEGELTYPAICWQCPRTEQTARQFTEQFGARRLYRITGYQAIPFNTLYKLLWLRRNDPSALAEAEGWLMMPGLLGHRLCGRMSLDLTAASTMMMLDIEKLQWAPELLEAAGVGEDFFPELVRPGEAIGGLTAEAAEATGLPAGITVAAGGHDTQFAPIGAGATPEEAVLSSGTWEIAMLRTEAPATGEAAFRRGVLTEVDAVEGLYDPQLLMMGSAVLEWVRETFYPGIEDRDEAYRTMIEEAGALPPGAGGVTMVPSFVPDTGPTGRHGTRGTLLGLRMSTGREQVYRAALEGLCFQLRQALATLCEAAGASPERLRVVGGGAKNELWNRLRADVCRVPVAVTDQKDATVVGAAVAAWVAAGRFQTLREGQEVLAVGTQTVEPGPDAGRYEELFDAYRRVPPGLEDFYAR